MWKCCKTYKQTQKESFFEYLFTKKPIQSKNMDWHRMTLGARWFFNTALIQTSRSLAWWWAPRSHIQYSSVSPEICSSSVIKSNQVKLNLSLVFTGIYSTVTLRNTALPSFWDFSISKDSGFVDFGPNSKGYLRVSINLNSSHSVLAQGE